MSKRTLITHKGINSETPAKIAKTTIESDVTKEDVDIVPTIKENKIYCGADRYIVKKNTNPLNKCVQYVQHMASIFKHYVDENRISSNDDSIAQLVVHLFVSSIFYNEALVYTNVKYAVIHSPIMLGEFIMYVNDKSADMLKIYIHEDAIRKFTTKDRIFKFSFSEGINNYTCDNLRKRSEVFTDSMENIFFKLLVIVDHATTHYMDEYITGTTDWINHFNFGRRYSNYTTVHNTLNISANIEVQKPQIFISNLKNINGAFVGLGQSSGLDIFNVQSFTELVVQDSLGLN